MPGWWSRVTVATPWLLIRDFPIWDRFFPLNPFDLFWNHILWIRMLLSPLGRGRCWWAGPMHFFIFFCSNVNTSSELSQPKADMTNQAWNSFPLSPDKASEILLQPQPIDQSWHMEWHLFFSPVLETVGPWENLLLFSGSQFPHLLNSGRCLPILTVLEWKIFEVGRHLCRAGF